ncbi:MAG: SIMPL domain-containing protein [Microcystaceae cyanobacterium]
MLKSPWVSSVMGTTLAIALSTPALPVLAQEKLLRTLTVTGEGVEMLATSLTQVELGVEITAPTAAQVQQTIAQRSNAVIDLLKSRGVEKLQTTGIQLNPNYEYANNQRKLNGYTGTNTVSFRLPTEQVGTLLDDAVKAGATRINGVSFTATDEAIASAQKLALKKATADAQSQAQVVLQSLNLSPREIIGIQINGANPPITPRYRADYMVQAAAAPAPTPVIGGEQSVRASVTLQINY